MREKHRDEKVTAKKKPVAAATGVKSSNPTNAVGINRGW